MKIKYLYFLYFTIILSLAACQSKWQQPFPGAEIVYQTGLYSQNKIGFIHPDGLYIRILNVGGYFRKPVWSSDGSFIYGLAMGIHNYDMGFPAYWENDKGIKICSNWGYMNQIEGTDNDIQKEAIISDGWTIRLVHLDKCIQIKVLIDYTNPADLTIVGFSYLSATHELIFGSMVTEFKTGEQSSKIIKKNLGSGAFVELVDGCNPTWSPDGTQIAYVAKDGIYIMKADGSQAYLISQHNFIDARTNRYGVVLPVPRWSPDGKWIIYHRCEVYDCFVNDNSIYKVNSIDGKEVKIIDSGGFPSWKP